MRPVLVETFVDLTKFEATSYRAANWQKIGMTKGRKVGARSSGKTQKGVYVFPLEKHWRSRLLNGAPLVKRRRRPVESPTLASDDPFVRLWSDLIGTAVAVAHDHDRVWQQRRRVLDTLLIMLFIFRLVFSKGRQGYAITLAELWEQCRGLGVELPKSRRFRPQPCARPEPSWTRTCSGFFMPGYSNRWSCLVSTSAGKGIVSSRSTGRG